MRLRVVSVEHTGTNFVERLLRGAGFEDISCSHYGDCHTDGWVVSPIRDPHLVYRTWWNRGRIEDDSGKARFWFSWLRFNERFLNGSVSVLPVDTEDREEHLARLSERLEVPLSTDWAPVESGAKADAPYMDLTVLYALPVVAAFYPRITQRESNG